MVSFTDCVLPQAVKDRAPFLSMTRSKAVIVYKVVFWNMDEISFISSNIHDKALVC